MAYVRFVAGFSRHPKRIKSGPVSSWLWACSVDYCTEFLTDGFIETEAVKTLSAAIVGSALKRAIDNLVAVGSWEVVPGGYKVHDYLKHNLSKAQSEADQEAGRQRYLRWKQRPESNAVTTPLDTPPPNAVGQSSPQRVSNTTHSQSVSQSDVKPTTPKGPVALATGSNGSEAEHEAKKAAALALIHRAYPGLTQPSGMTP